MQAVNRRIVLGGFLGSFLGGIDPVAMVRPAYAETVEDFSVDAEEGSVAVTRYAAHQIGRRGGVLVLHGSRGLELKLHAYQRYADALNAAGFDVYLVRYFTDADTQALAPNKNTRQRREAYEADRYDGWTRRVSSVVTAILARSECSGRIGLLGFSLGGFVAANTAVRDERIAALAVLYGGMPDAMVSEVKHLPPLIELHGEADRNVPLAEGQKLVRLANAVGSTAEQVTYPGKEHGFDFSDTDPATADAVGRVTGFFHAKLG